MTRPYKRACHQTNFSKGGFVKKDSFSFFLLFFPFFYFLFPISMGFFTIFFSLHLLKDWGDSVWWSQAAGGSPANIRKMN